MKNHPLYIVFVLIIGLYGCLGDKPPTVSIIIPSENDEFEQGEIVPISVNANDKDGAISEVRLIIDGIGIEAIASFPYEFNWSTIEVELGMHTIQVEAIDDGNNSATDEINISIVEPGEIDTVVIAIISPTEDEEIERGDNTGIIVYVEDENRVVSEVNFYIDEFWIASSTSFPYTVLWNTGDYSLGIHTIKVEAWDDSGPITSDEISVTLFEVAVSATITNPTDDETIELGEVVDIYVDVLDVNGIVSEVRFYIDGFGVSSSNGFPYNFNWNTGEEDPGIHTITVEARDGSRPVDSDEISVTLFEPEPDTVSVILVNPLNGEDIEQGETVIISVNLNDEGNRVTELRYYIDGFGVGTAGGFPYSYIWNTDEIDLGSHIIKVEARDDDGPLDIDEISVQIIASS
jgi:hypothetical protein